MKCIFEASSGLEAHMILNLLQQQGINARVDGEFLQGGVGELQAMNIVRVMVDDSAYKRARGIIDEWESTPATASPDKVSTNSNKNFGAGLLIGLLVGAGFTFWAYNSPISNDGIDYNNDGQLDEKWVYKDNRIYRATSDRNLDGEEDIQHYYDRHGRIYKTVSDDNFDGAFESTYKYRRGNIYLQETDTTGDGNIDYRAHLNNGVFTEAEILDPQLDVPKKKQIYKLNKLVSSEYDSNSDGILDVIYEYDFYEEIKSKSNKTLNRIGAENAPPS